MLVVPEVNVIATGDGLDAYVVKTSVPPTTPVAGAVQVITGVPLLMVNDCGTAVAGLQFASPVCLAVNVQVPTLSRFTLNGEAEPDTVQMVLSVGVNVTSRPELAVAGTDNGDDAIVVFAGSANVIVWLPLLMVIVSVACAAAFQLAFAA
jgi:hypothetical protein